MRQIKAKRALRRWLQRGAAPARGAHGKRLGSAPDSFFFFFPGVKRIHAE